MSNFAWATNKTDGKVISVLLWNWAWSNSMFRSYPKSEVIMYLLFLISAGARRKVSPLSFFQHLTSFSICESYASTHGSNTIILGRTRLRTKHVWLWADIACSYIEIEKINMEPRILLWQYILARDVLCGQTWAHGWCMRVRVFLRLQDVARGQVRG